MFRAGDAKMSFALVGGARFLVYIVGSLLAVFVSESRREVGFSILATVADRDNMVCVPLVGGANFAPADMADAAVRLEYAELHARRDWRVWSRANPFGDAARGHAAFPELAASVSGVVPISAATVSIRAVLER